MSGSLFPAAGAGSGHTDTGGVLPLAREAAWDFELDRPIFRRGEPVVVTGLEAVLVWAWNALKTVRYRYRHHTRGYGCELERLVGQPYGEDVKRSEAARYVREALEISPYITGVENVYVEFGGNTLTVTATLETIYGEKEMTAHV